MLSSNFGGAKPNQFPELLRRRIGNLPLSHLFLTITLPSKTASYKAEGSPRSLHRGTLLFEVASKIDQLRKLNSSRTYMDVDLLTRKWRVFRILWCRRMSMIAYRGIEGKSWATVLGLLALASWLAGRSGS